MSFASVLIIVLNFILASCNYSYIITEDMIPPGSDKALYLCAEYCLREGKVLKAEESLREFWMREDVQQAVRNCPTDITPELIAIVARIAQGETHDGAVRADWTA